MLHPYVSERDRIWLGNTLKDRNFRSDEQQRAELQNVDLRVRSLFQTTSSIPEGVSTQFFPVSVELDTGGSQEWFVVPFELVASRSLAGVIKNIGYLCVLPVMQVFLEYDVLVRVKLVLADKSQTTTVIPISKTVN